MNWLEFIASLFRSLTSLAWPVAVVICVALFRGRIWELLPRLHLKHKDFEASFRLEKAEKEAKLLGAPVDQAPEPTPEERKRFDQLARLSPRGAILEARADLDSAVRRLAEDADISNSRRASLPSLIRQLRAKEKIDPTISALLDDLRNVGNAAAHSDDDQEFTFEDARRYRDLTDRALASIEWSRMLPFMVPYRNNPRRAASLSELRCLPRGFCAKHHRQLLSKRCSRCGPQEARRRSRSASAGVGICRKRCPACGRSYISSLKRSSLTPPWLTCWASCYLTSGEDSGALTCIGRTV
jgi:hypothetical protein